MFTSQRWIVTLHGARRRCTSPQQRATRSRMVTFRSIFWICVRGCRPETPRLPSEGNTVDRHCRAIAEFFGRCRQQVAIVYGAYSGLLITRWIGDNKGSLRLHGQNGSQELRKHNEMCHNLALPSDLAEPIVALTRERQPRMNFADTSGRRGGLTSALLAARGQRRSRLHAPHGLAPVGGTSR